MQNIVEKRRYQEKIQRLKDEHQQTLRHVFKFMHEDMIANQQGQFTPRHLQSLKKRKMMKIATLIGIAFAVSLIFIISLELGEINYKDSPTAIGLIVGIPTLYTVIILFFGRKTIQRLNTAKLEPITGTVRKREYMRRAGRGIEKVFELQINFYQLEVTQKQYQQISEDYVYRIYYIPETHDIASIEVADIVDSAKHDLTLSGRLF